MNLTALFDDALTQKASDIHLATGEIPCLRIDGNLVRLAMPDLTAETLTSLLDPFVSQEAWMRVRSGIPFERTMLHGECNFTLTLFRAANDGFAGTFRILNAGVPNLEQVGERAMAILEQIVAAPRGLVLIAGPTGSGKVTASSSIVDAINRTKPARIFVIQGGRNFTYRSKIGMVTQLNVGQDFDSYERALDVAQRVDPDVIAVDDIATAEALRQVVMLAETGHLVIANLHADSVADVFRRLFHAAGRDADALHHALAKNLLAITVQRLFKRASGKGRVAAFEWLYSTPAVRQAIEAGDLGQIEALQASEPECRTLKAALDDLVDTGNITPEVAAASLAGN